MSGRTSRETFDAMKLVRRKNVVPLHAAEKVGIDPGTLYGSRLYRMWKEGTPESLAQLDAELKPKRKQVQRKRPAPK